MKQLLQTILEPMLEHPEALEIEVEETKYNVSYKIRTSGYMKAAQQKKRWINDSGVVHINFSML